jgi:predicted enzyme related to lactoylglutathione lyase
MDAAGMANLLEKRERIMSIEARFVHINIVARDWQRLARFYEQVFGCQPVPPERDLAGPWLEQATGIPGARIHGVHLRLPGHGQAGPTLEIFQYAQEEEGPRPAINRPGLAHIALAVADVQAARQAVLAAGGSALGEIVSAEIAGAGRVTFAYVSDPEGNFIELQRWR